MQSPSHSLWMTHEANKCLQNNPRISVLQVKILLFNMVWKQACHTLINLNTLLKTEKKEF